MTAPDGGRHHEPRCRRAARCVERVRDGDGWAGALLDAPGLCPACVQTISWDISDLHEDVTRLTMQLGKTAGAWRAQDPRVPMPPRTLLHPPVPIRVDVEALRALIDYETGEWADMLAGWLGSDVARNWLRYQRRLGNRVQTACHFLGHRMTELLAMPAICYRARSLTGRRGDGHPEVARGAWDYWTTRDGVDAAILLAELHRKARAVTGQTADWCPVPCPLCNRQSLVRQHRARRVVCRNTDCGHRMSDDDYDALMNVFTPGLNDQEDL